MNAPFILPMQGFEVVSSTMKAPTGNQTRRLDMAAWEWFVIASVNISINNVASAIDVNAIVIVQWGVVNLIEMRSPVIAAATAAQVFFAQGISQFVAIAASWHAVPLPLVYCPGDVALFCGASGGDGNTVVQDMTFTVYGKLKRARRS